MSQLPEFEKMDLFYLGRELDPQSGETSRQPFLFKNSQLTTHGVILGMTGSGKTGLGIALLEEAALDKIPAIIIDPKGDMANLLLSFPELAPSDFEPWVGDEQARQMGLSYGELAQKTAADWESGLASWEQDKGRIARMREAAEFSVYTPGSSAGQPVSVLDSLRAPDPSVLADDEVMAGLVNSAVSSLLVLVGINADPLKSREHILLSSILLTHWRNQEDVDLESLIGSVVTPPFEKVGVFPLESFYPQPKRMKLALQLNNIIASPSFASWTQGVPLDIDSFLYTDTGKPCHSIFTLSHLSDEERMFFVTMLLGRLLAWMRQQEGTGSLRCLLYMDEIFGYFPSGANPPAKKTMLLLLKQARSFGLGIVLSTQNPVDLDYKGLSNIGTWFIGRLQTRQDQDRVLAGISAGADGFYIGQLREKIANMRERTFLMSSTHRPEPIVFETRWVLSYLKGPVSLRDIGRLVKRQSSVKVNVLPEGRTRGDLTTLSSTLPLLPANITQRFIPSPVPMEKIEYKPFLIGCARIRFFDKRRTVDQKQEICLQLPAGLNVSGFDWEDATPSSVDPELGQVDSPSGSYFFSPSTALTHSKNITELKKKFSDFLYHNQKIELLVVKALKFESKPGETAKQFHLRLATLLRQKKQVKVDTVETRFRKKQQHLQVLLEKAEARLDKEKSDVTARGVDTALSFGLAVLGGLFGGKGMSLASASRSARGVRSAGRLLKEKADVERAKQDLVRSQDALQALVVDLQETLSAISDRFDPSQFNVETTAITPRRSDIYNVQLSLLWEPIFDFSDHC